MATSATIASIATPRTQERDYAAAIEALNSLQSNAATIAKTNRERDQLRHRNVPDTRAYLSALGVDSARLSQLSVIHVTGTKGKGSTCAFAESLLRARGFRTGFFSSPHLVQVRERIRLNGEPINKNKFAHYFWHVYDHLDVYCSYNAAQQFDAPSVDSWAPPCKMPAYFRFLTVMALYVFLEEGVDAAIMEVGIGGRFDCTNVVPSPRVAVVTSLGLDHTSMLGASVEQIAWHKAGIFKEGAVALTTYDQPPNALNILEVEARKVNCPLYLIPSLDCYTTADGQTVKLGIGGDVQRINASLALQAVRSFCNESQLNCTVEKHAQIVPGFELTDTELTALSNTRWLGRHQIIVCDKLRVFLDGAHTPESIALTANWFHEQVKQSAPRRRVLIFNATGDRQAETLLRPLADLRLFDTALFCPNVVHMMRQSSDSDLENRMIVQGAAETRCVRNAEVWRSLCDGSSAHVCDSVMEAQEWLENESQNQELDVLITGSLHLIGCALKLLIPGLSE